MYPAADLFKRGAFPDRLLIAPWSDPLLGAQVPRLLAHLRAPVCEILPFHPRHAAGFRDLVEKTLVEFGFQVDPVLERDLDDPATAYDAAWVVVAEGEVVGSVAMRRTAEREAELKRMYVRPAWRRRGIGRRLLETALGWARAQRLRTVRLDTAERMMAARRLYETAGFSRTGSRVEGGRRDRRCEELYALELDRG
jgi:GNAT superfamily N-acetyltransferase